MRSHECERGTRVAHALLTLLKKPFAGHGPAPRGMYVVDLQWWGRAVPCRSAFHRAFFSNVTLACRVATSGRRTAVVKTQHRQLTSWPRRLGLEADQGTRC